jgi:hypothetical protein
MAKTITRNAQLRAVTRIVLKLRGIGLRGDVGVNWRPPSSVLLELLKY